MAPATGSSFKSLASGIRRFQAEEGEKIKLTQVQVAAQPNAELARAPGRVLRCPPSPTGSASSYWKASTVASAAAATSTRPAGLGALRSCTALRRLPPGRFRRSASSPDRVAGRQGPSTPRSSHADIMKSHADHYIPRRSLNSHFRTSPASTAPQTPSPEPRHTTAKNPEMITRSPGQRSAHGVISNGFVRDPFPAAGRRTQGPGHVHYRQEQAEHRQDHGRHGRGRPGAVLQPDRPRKLRGHHTRPPVRAGQAPGRRSRRGPEYRQRLARNILGQTDRIPQKGKTATGLRPPSQPRRLSTCDEKITSRWMLIHAIL